MIAREPQRLLHPDLATYFHTTALLDKLVLGVFEGCNNDSICGFSVSQAFPYRFEVR